jgi:hypothetical protein
MKTLFVLLMMCFSGEIEEPSVSEGSVYICTGPGAKRYHAYKDCRGLNRCSADIKAVSLQKAKNMGLTPCQICY